VKTIVRKYVEILSGNELSPFLVRSSGFRFKLSSPVSFFSGNVSVGGEHNFSKQRVFLPQKYMLRKVRVPLLHLILMKN
jgi:hypothetical protein